MTKAIRNGLRKADKAAEEGIAKMLPGFRRATEAFDQEFKEKAERVRRKLSRGIRRTKTDPV